MNYLDIIGIQFYENNRDPASPTFNKNAAGGASGLQFYAPGGNVLIEDCQFSFYKNNLDIEGLNGPLSNITLRRNIVMNSWNTSGHSQGIYSFSVTNITLYQNVFDHNGWNTQISGAGDTGFNHNVYFSSTVVNADIEQNIIANASFAGVMARSGGTILNNLFLVNAIAVSFGDADGADSTVGGVSGQLTGNIVIGDKAVGTTLYGQGFEIGNTKPGADVMVSNNIFTQDTQQSKDAIQLTMATATDNPQDAVGENDVTIQGNITNGWYRGYDSDGRFISGGTGLFAFNDIKVLNNDFINSTNRVVRHDAPMDTTQEFWSGNRYYTSHLTTPNWFLLQSNTLSYAQWAAAYDQMGKQLTSVPYADPNRTAATYDSTLGGPGTLADFLAQAELMSGTNYRPQFMAQAAMDYVRKGLRPTPMLQPRWPTRPILEPLPRARRRLISRLPTPTIF